MTEERFEVKATAESHFSWMRTRMSLERTLMSWIRTAVTLIGFGFTIFQFLSKLNDTPGVTPATHPHAPWIFGMALIGTGTVGLAIAIIEYKQTLSYLWSDGFKQLAGIDQGPRHTPTILVAAVLILIGTFTFAAVALRVH